MLKNQVNYLPVYQEDELLEVALHHIITNRLIDMLETARKNPVFSDN